MAITSSRPSPLMDDSKRLRRALKAGADGCRQHFARCFAHRINRIAQRDARPQVEGNGYGGQLSQVIDGERAQRPR